MKLYIVIALILILTGCNSVGYRDSLETPIGDVRVDTREVNGNFLGNIKVGGWNFDI